MAYMGGITAATTAATAEKQRQKRLAEEEQDMTPYTRTDLDGDWEFKIVRSDVGAFRKPEVLNDLLEEQAQAGWVMLEKFDNNRVRFKRPRSARARDAFLPDGVDPYRTRYGTGSAQSTVMAIFIGLLALGVSSFIVLSNKLPMPASNAWPIVAVITLLLVVGVAAVKRRSS